MSVVCERQRCDARYSEIKVLRICWIRSFCGNSMSIFLVRYSTVFIFIFFNILLLCSWIFFWVKCLYVCWCWWCCENDLYVLWALWHAFMDHDKSMFMRIYVTFLCINAVLIPYNFICEKKIFVKDRKFTQ